MSRSTFETVPRALDSNGDPVSGARLYVYEAGSTTDVVTYSDSALSTPHTQPVVADAAGYFPQVYASPGLYKYVVKDASDATLAEADNVRQDSGTLTFTSTALLLDAISNYGATYPVGTMFHSPDVTYEKTASGWTGQVSSDDLMELIAAKLPNADNSVDNANLANMPSNTLKGNNSTITADPKDLTPQEAMTLLGFDFDRGVPGQWKFGLESGASNPMIVKYGFDTVEGTVTYTEPFPTGVFAVFATMRGTGGPYAVSIFSTPVTGFDAYPKEWNGSAWVTSTAGYNWMSIGY